MAPIDLPVLNIVLHQQIVHFHALIHHEEVGDFPSTHADDGRADSVHSLFLAWLERRHTPCVLYNLGQQAVGELVGRLEVIFLYELIALAVLVL